MSFTLIKNRDIIYDIFKIFLQQILSSKLLLAITSEWKIISMVSSAYHLIFYKKKNLSPNNLRNDVHNIFTTNPKCQIVTSCYCWIKKIISVLNSNLN